MRRSPQVRSVRHALTALAVAATIATAASAMEFPAPSPGSTLKQRVGLTDIEVVYSRPGVKGRQIFGGLESYGKVWRTGANASTKITFSTPVKFGGADVPAGTYALYSIPGEQEWTVILSKKTDLWGSFGYNPADDLVRVKVKPVTMADFVETFRIDINEIRDSSAVLRLEWQKTSVPVRIDVDFERQLVAEIEATMSGSDAKKPYHQAAQFYFDHGQDLAKARTWIDAAIAENPNAYWSLHLQAKILAKLGDKAGAIAAAKKSIEVATRSGDNSYVKSNNELLATLN
jgi:hypothetical protein